MTARVYDFHRHHEARRVQQAHAEALNASLPAIQQAAAIVLAAKRLARNLPDPADRLDAYHVAMAQLADLANKCLTDTVTILWRGLVRERDGVLREMGR